jgi:hypothetical protein
MKKSLIVSAVIVLIAGFTTKVNAQATQNTAAGAVLITPISITQTSPLHFGVMAVQSGLDGTCILSTAGVRTATGGVNLSVQAPLATNAAYTVGGSLNTTYAITLPASITVTSSSFSMIIDNLLAKAASAASDGLTGTLNGSGSDSFTVGGTLNVTAGKPAGVYAGTFNVTVAYN